MTAQGWPKMRLEERKKKMVELTDRQNELLAQLVTLSAELGSAQKACAKIGVSSSTYSEIKNGRYRGVPEGFFAKVEEYFSVKSELSDCYKEVEYADTYVSKQVYEIIRLCQIKGGLAVACGDAGIGKTKAARKYVEEHSANSCIITINNCFRNVGSLLKLVARMIGAPQERSKDEQWWAIVSRLTDGSVLIFDEAQHLSRNGIEVLRSISDYFADVGQTLGIVFIGNCETITTVSSKKAEFAQICNRAKQSKLFKTNDIRRGDIEKLFPLLEGKKKEIELLWKIAQTTQSIRGANNLFSNAYDNGDYSYEGLLAMAKDMGMVI